MPRRSVRLAMKAIHRANTLCAKLASESVANSLVEHATRHATCVHPDNQPIYRAVVEKALSYPLEKPYNRQAYLKAAAGLLTLETSLQENYYAAFRVEGTGPQTKDFIYETARRTYCPCKREENEHIYRYLMYETPHIFYDCAYERVADAIAALDKPLWLNKETGQLNAVLPGHPLIIAAVKRYISY
jgi:hypothetical protein